MATKKDELLEFTDEENALLDEGVQGGADATATMSGPLRQRLGVFKRLAVTRMVNREKVGRAEAIAAVSALGDGKILEWIIAHGPEIIAFVKMIMALFGL